MSKPFKDTKLGQFLAVKAPNLLAKVGDLLPDSGVLGIIKRAVDSSPDLPDEDKLEYARLHQEHEQKMYELEIKDRESARTREVELAKTGKHDFLMYITGMIILVAFCVVVYASVFMAVEGDHFVRISTMVETLTIAISGYYFGSSKGSADKTKLVHK